MFVTGDLRVPWTLFHTINVKWTAGHVIAEAQLAPTNDSLLTSCVCCGELQRLNASWQQTTAHAKTGGKDAIKKINSNNNNKNLNFCIILFQNLLPTCAIGCAVLRLVSFVINKYYTRLLSLWKVIEDESTWLLLTFLQGLHVDNPCEHQGMCSQAHYAMYNTCNQQCTCSIFLTSGHYTRYQLLRGWQPFLATRACWESTGRRAKDAFCPHQDGNTRDQ